MNSQKALIESTEWDYLIITDAGRYDTFREIYREYFGSEAAETLKRVHNGGHTFTGTWFADAFDGIYNATMFHGGVPIYAFETNPADYDERDHFPEVVSFEKYEWDNRVSTCPPEEVVRVVEENDPDRAVIRFLQPHGPYRYLFGTSGVGVASNHSHEDLLSAYRENYEWVLSTIASDLFDLDTIRGRVVITSDHGECLGDCGQYQHNLGHEPHPHLTEVPWVELTV